MKNKTIKTKRLPKSFHKTFKPERQYINAMLRFAASGGDGDYQAIAASTGIPTGVSSGKVPATLDYCLGMGLLTLSACKPSSIKKPQLTPFGRVVLLEDPFLKTSITQWICHFNLCGGMHGADVWYQSFFTATPALGMAFSKADLESYLGNLYGASRSSFSGPLVGMYDDDASFKICSAISEVDGQLVRRPAPIVEEMGFAYGAWILQLIREWFPKSNQVSVTDLDAVAGWRTIPGWDVTSLQRVLELVARKGLIEVDRHMEPWLIIPKVSADNAWRKIFDDMI